MKKICMTLSIFCLMGFTGLNTAYAAEDKMTSSDAQQIREIQSDEGCKFIKDRYLETSYQPGTQKMDMTQIESETKKAGGNAFKILSEEGNVHSGSAPKETMSTRGSTGKKTIHFNIYNCSQPR